MDKYPLQSYADYSSFSTIVITDDMAAIYKKATNELMRNWGYDPEGCEQELFQEQELFGFSDLLFLL